MKFLSKTLLQRCGNGFSGLVATSAYIVLSRLSVRLAATAVLITFATGCGKHSQAPAASTAPMTNSAVAEASEATQSPDGTTASALPAAVDADGAPDLAELSRRLRRWIVSHRRVPENFEEFAATAGVQVPPPPAGKKYAINKSTVLLVDR